MCLWSSNLIDCNAFVDQRKKQFHLCVIPGFATTVSTRLIFYWFPPGHNFKEGGQIIYHAKQSLPAEKKHKTTKLCSRELSALKSKT